MSDQTTAVVDPTAPATPATTTVAATPAPVTTTAAPATRADDQNPPWLAERLERERKAMLKTLGVESEDDAKKALADFKAKQDAEKTEAQRNAEKLSELDRTKARASELEATVKGRASRELAGLSDAQRAAVLAIAGEDPAAQLKTIDALAPTWATAAPVATTTTPAATPAAAPAAATTAPPRSAPSDTTQTQASPKETYQRLKAANPVAAAAYLKQHAQEIYPSS